MFPEDTYEHKKLEEIARNLEEKCTKLEENLRYIGKFSQKEDAEIKQDSLKILQISTAHGFTKLINSKNVLFRAFWALFFLASVVGCAYFIMKTFSEFFRYDVITEMKIINNNSIVFPAITICNRLENEYRIDKLLYRCFYKDYSKISGSDSNNCFPEDFASIAIKYQNSKIRNCYRFNSGKNNNGDSVSLKTTSKVGYSHGLHLYLYRPSNDIFNIYIGESLYHPVFTEMYRLLDSGTTTAIIIKKHVEKKLKEPHNSCVSTYEYSLNPWLSHELVNQSVAKNTIYRQINCYQMCSQLLEWKINCSDNCPLECETISYSTTQQAIDYKPSPSRFLKSKEAIKQLNNISGISDEMLRRSMLSLYIYYEDLTYAEIGQIPKVTGPDLISDIGGTLGLFLGVSLMSFVEVIELAMMILI